MPNNDLIVGVDIGTTKVCVVIAHLEEDGTTKITGLGCSPSQGLRRGVVVDLDKTVQAIKQAVRDAEMMAGFKAKKVYVGIAGEHIRGLNSRGVVAVANSDNEIKSRDIQRVLEAAKSVAIPQDREIIHILPQEFTVDDQNGIKDPSGMSGVRLEAEVHIVTSGVTSAQNLYKSIWMGDLEVEELVLESLASSWAVMTPEEKELGAVIIDLGGGTSDVAIFYDGAIRHTAVIGLGGKNVTSDIAIGLRTPVDQAELLKKNYGCALATLVDADEIISVPGVGGRPAREISRSVLAGIIEPRMEEIFGMVHKEIKKSNLGPLLAAGAVLTGGGALLQGSVELAEQVFDMPARVGHTFGYHGLEEIAQSPIYATGVGLVRYGLSRSQNGQSFRKNGHKFNSNYFGKVKDWFNQYFN
ncbi:MAG: cell division protein FtsA [candidate division Zixibacteria bacterium]|nr:cell division protein FtsA [candidate division Zixibacteria bacterium]